MLAWLLFFFIAFGAKVVLACAMIYLILPADRVCSGCDAETLPLRMGGMGRLCARVMLNRIQRRFCPRCGWEGFIRITDRPLTDLRSADAGRRAPAPR
jgi:hypothetical protein